MTRIEGFGKGRREFWRFKQILKSFSKVCTLLLSVVLYSSFLIAYFCENQSVYLSVNDHGEGFIELIVFSIVMVFVFVGFFMKKEGVIA